MRVHVWAEDRPEPGVEARMRQIYPQGVEGTIAALLRENRDKAVTSSTMRDPMQGFDRRILDDTDVLVYWSHKHWREVEEETVDYLHRRVLEGMGLIVLHSAHASKLFARLMGTRTQCLRWRENDEHQRYWIVNPAHPIAAGLSGEYFEIPMDETYGEYFEIPQPQEQVFLTWSPGGELFRSGCCWTRGLGRIFYFQGGHETYPVYLQKEVRQVLTNAVRWACAPGKSDGFPTWARESAPLENGEMYNQHKKIPFDF